MQKKRHGHTSPRAPPVAAWWEVSFDDYMPARTALRKFGVAVQFPDDGQRPFFRFLGSRLRHLSRSIPTNPDSFVKTKPIPANCPLVLHTRSKVLHVFESVELAGAPLVCTGIFVCLPLRKRIRQQTHCGNWRSSSGMFTAGCRRSCRTARTVSSGASCERGQGLVDNKNLPAHFHGDEIAVTNERNDVFFRQAELKPSLRKRYEQRFAVFMTAMMLAGGELVTATWNSGRVKTAVSGRFYAGIMDAKDLLACEWFGEFASFAFRLILHFLS